MNERNNHIRSIMTWVAALLSLGYFCYLFIWQVYMPIHADIWEVMMAHYAVFIGLPSAALLSFLIVLLLEQSAGGNIEFSGLGFTFKGASGQIVLWVFCFLAITGAIKLLW